MCELSQWRACHKAIHSYPTRFTTYWTFVSSYLFAAIFSPIDRVAVFIGSFLCKSNREAVFISRKTFLPFSLSVWKNDYKAKHGFPLTDRTG
jgi:hypothetical protein